MKLHLSVFGPLAGVFLLTLRLTAAAPETGLLIHATEDARKISATSLAQPLSPAQWQATLASRRAQWLEMLGLAPLPERTPLHVTVTGELDRGGYVVEKIHFESIPGAHVTANLYRPARPTGRLPAVLFLCGHSPQGKAAPSYQSNARWFGEHGYVCLDVDPVQVGEGQGVHAGTYRDGRWDWISRGYTPAGMEVWNGMRALDYLETRPDVDPKRIGLTGLSGGGAISWFLAAADERVRVVSPVCQTGSIGRVAADRSLDGHCDCAFWINTQRWCFPDLGALIAPRPFLGASGSDDILWRPTAFHDVARRIGAQYAALGVPNNYALVEDTTPHGYTPKLRRAIFTFFNTHLRGDPTPVQDDVTAFLEPEANLRVFGGKLPAGDTMRRMDELLVPPTVVALPDDEAQWRMQQTTALARLCTTVFRQVPADIMPTPGEVREDGATPEGDVFRTFDFATPDGLALAVKTRRLRADTGRAPTIVFAHPPSARMNFLLGNRQRPAFAPEFTLASVEVRNTAATSTGPGALTTLRRLYALIGYSLPERQVHDLLAGAALLRRNAATSPIVLFGQGETAALALYAAVLDPRVDELILQAPPETHTKPDTAELPGILRIGDLPQNLALLYPRPITFVGAVPPAYAWTRALYEKLGAAERIRTIAHVREWRPWSPAAQK